MERDRVAIADFVGDVGCTTSGLHSHKKNTMLGVSLFVVNGRRRDEEAITGAPPRIK